ncbi:MAG: hypothetical protein ACYC9S_12815, partial [Leptospirales bacterium]
LYAPYESTIPPAIPENNNQPTPELKAIPATIDAVTTMKAQIEEAVKAKDWSPISVFSRDGKTYVAMVDNAHIAMIYEESDGIIQGKGEVPIGQRVMVPKLDYSDSNCAQFSLDRNMQKLLMQMARDHKNADDIVFHKPSGSHDAYVFIRGQDEDRRTPIIMGEPLKFMIQNSNGEELTTHLSREYFAMIMKAMGKLEKVNNVQALNVKFRQDYPVEISGRSGNTTFASLIAPKMSDLEWKVIKELHGKVGIGSGN